MPANMICAQRLFLTADKAELVGESDARAAFLFASPGDEIPASAAERFGLVDGALPGKGAKPAPATKPKKATQAKPKPAAETKA